MYSLYLRCRPEEAEQMSVALWEAGTEGIREESSADCVTLIAGFHDGVSRLALTAKFSAFEPRWEREADIDWVAATQIAWPAREIGERLFLAPVWNTRATPAGRLRLIHNPGLASGTGEHACTQLALESLEKTVFPGSVVADLGTGSGILALAARRFGARLAVGLDTHAESLVTAIENFRLNNLSPTLVLGSADCVASGFADVLVANISATVLLSLADELLNIVRPGGRCILTGFPESELTAMTGIFGQGTVTERNEWRCVTLLCG